MNKKNKRISNSAVLINCCELTNKNVEFFNDKFSPYQSTKSRSETFVYWKFANLFEKQFNKCQKKWDKEADKLEREQRKEFKKKFEKELKVEEVVKEKRYQEETKRRGVVNCLYEYFKNTPKKLKIVCDWDEVIQCLEPFALYLALKNTKSVSPGLEKLSKVINQNDFRKRVYEACSQIPAGKVSTYKIISQLVYGSPNYARRVGNFLSRCPDCVSKSQNYDCPRIHCYRVIKSDFWVGGFLGESGERHKKITLKKLTSEGLVFDKKGHLAKELREKVVFKGFKKKIINSSDWEQEKQYFSPFFETFWKSNLIDYSPYGSKLNKEFSEQAAQKNTPNFYSSAPFLSLARELLMLVKEQKAEVIFLSAYDQRVFDSGDPRKKKIFKETFGKYPNCSLSLVGFESEGKGQSKSEWVKKNVPDCEVIIDDNPNILSNVIKDNGKIITVAPFYPTIKHHEKVILIKNSISNLKKGDFNPS